MSDAPRLRLFVAASVPEEHLAWTSSVIDELRGLWPEARWTNEAARHVTLKFLGATEPGALEEVAHACASVAAVHQRSSLALSGLGAFPSARRARVLWVGLQDPSDLLAGVAAGLDRQLQPLGFAAEARPYHPHLTLARFRTPQRLELPEVAPPEPFTADGFHLWRSHLSPKGARYETLRTFRLGSGHAP